MSGCSEYRRFARHTRREALKVGMLGGLGVTLPTMLRQQALAANGSKAKAKSVILMWLQGGVSHHETFDTKPDAPADVRGEMSPIKTNIPGVFVGEHLPRLSTMMDKISVIRSCTHNEAAHQRGSIYMVEGRRPPRATGVEHSGNPQLGAIVSYELGMRNGIPPFVSIPGNDFTSRFVGPGWLPPSADAFAGFNAKSLEMPGGFSRNRFEDRLALHQSMEQLSAPERSETEGGRQNWDRFSQQAVDIIASAKAAEAFNWQSESDAMQRLYGIIDESGKKNSGQLPELCLTARRLVEAGCRYVTIGRNSWDHHSNMFPQLRSRLPRFDAAFAGLVTDLEQRGMLDDTLVVYLTEFGRTPKVNSQAGRDHWPNVFSVAFAGAGIKAGQVLGASDNIGGKVADFPVSPEEIGVTILNLAGIGPQTIFHRPDGRPMHYIDEAQPIGPLLA